jgi:aryl-alcohol dehydrogenase-like predicted oxidoreductase
MQHNILGGTGMSVSRFALGTMSFGALGNRDHDDCAQIIRAALDAGINVIDTADIYSSGESETIVGRALKGRRDDVILSSKCYWLMSADPNHRGGSRRWIMRALESSLKRLDTDHLDIFYLHKPDLSTDLEESLSALSDLVHQGKVIAVGISGFPGSSIVESHWISERCHLVKPRVEQPPYSLLTRGVERDVLPTAARLGLGVLTWGPLNSGWLTGKYSDDSAPPESRATRWARSAPEFDVDRPQVQHKLALVQELQRIAGDAGCTLTHLALAFCAEHPAVSAVILGPRRLDQLTDMLGAADLRLDFDTLDQIDTAVPPGYDVDAQYSQGWDPPWLTEPALRRRR